MYDLISPGNGLNERELNMAYCVDLRNFLIEKNNWTISVYLNGW